MKKILRTFVLLATGFLFLIPALSNVGGCSSGGNAPPATIPAPVSSLIAVSKPDATGLIVVTGEIGAVKPNAEVLAANITKGGTVLRWEDLIISSAFAQTFEATTNADDLGRFSLNIDGSSGDQIGIRQQIGTDQSDITTVDVP